MALNTYSVMWADVFITRAFEKLFSKTLYKGSTSLSLSFQKIIAISVNDAHDIYYLYWQYRPA